MSSLVEAKVHPHFIEAFDINNRGQIVAADRHWFYLLTPQRK